MNQIVPCEGDHVIPDRRPACFSRPSVAVPGSGAEPRSLSRCLIGAYRTDANDCLDGAISLSWHPSRGPSNGRMKACSLSPGSRRLVGCSSSGGLGRLCYWSGVVVASLMSINSGRASRNHPAPNPSPIVSSASRSPASARFSAFTRLRSSLGRLPPTICHCTVLP